MPRFVESLTNRYTMYRLTEYVLIAFLVWAGFLALFGLLPFSFFSLLFTVLFLVLTCNLSNEVFARLFRVTPNIESATITALILTLIVTPVFNLNSLPLLFGASAGAMASKYLFVFRRKHLFNPAAFGVFFTSITLHQAASWWVGTAAMLFPVLVGCYLIVAKIRRFDLMLGFFTTASLVYLISSAPLLSAFLESPLVFFAGVMLVEPLTSPSIQKWRSLYGVVVGLLAVYTPPELALLAGNLFTFIANPNHRLTLALKVKTRLTPEIYDFRFIPPHRFSYLPGQYMEWTLPVSHADARGNRRLFSLASSPTESDIRVGVKFNPQGSRFKQRLMALKPGDSIVAAQVAGDFILPKDYSRKLVFIAGGIGITPYRSMLKYLIDRQEKRDIILLYVNRHPQDVVYQDILSAAQKVIGLHVVHHFTARKNHLTSQVIEQHLPDYPGRYFYISGPQPFVVAVTAILKQLGIPPAQRVTDYFPGYA